MMSVWEREIELEKKWILENQKYHKNENPALILLNETTEIFKECIEILKKKNHDYRPNEDPFGNFRLCEVLGVCEVEIGIYTRMLDKMTRIAAILKKKDTAVRDETIEDTLKDLINYSAILLSYIRIKTRKGDEWEK
jgi:hypothetical protein